MISAKVPQSGIILVSTAAHQLRSLMDTNLGTAIKTLLVIGTTGLVLESGGFSLTWYLGKIWGDAGSTCQRLWTELLKLTGEDEYMLYTVGMLVVAQIVYYVVCPIYSLMDYTDKPKFLRKFKTDDNYKKYKSPPGTTEPMDWTKMIKIISFASFNHLVVTGIFTMGPFAWAWQWRQQFGPLIAARRYEIGILPEFHWVVAELAIFVVAQEILFYYSHRLLHHRWIYKYIHKKHHENNASMSWVAMYYNPLDHLTSALVPVAAGPLICGSHVATNWLWTIISIFTTLTDHEGYHFPIIPNPDSHEYHHLTWTQCYGTLGILDYLHGTDIVYREIKDHQRQFLSSIDNNLKETAPDDDVPLTVFQKDKFN